MKTSKNTHVTKFIHFLLNIEQFTPYLSCSVVKGDGIKVVAAHSLFINSGINQFQSNDLEEEIVIKTINIFSIFDAFIDSANPDIEGLSFNEKYEKIPELNDLCKIKKTLYRILSLIRNKIIHAPSDVCISNEFTSISNKGRSIEISNSSLNLIFELVLIIIEYDGVVDSYFDLIVKSYYNDIRFGIKNISDGKGYIPDNYQLNKFFSHKGRFLIFVGELNFESNESIYIKLHMSKLKIESIEVQDSDDYLIKSSENELYLLPGFEIPDDGVISKEDISKWRLGSKWFGRTSVISNIGVELAG